MDNENKNDQNSEMSSASMHDVPLSNEEQEETVQGPIEKIPSKNGSLKRFFKLSSNKRNANDVKEVNTKTTETDDVDVNEDNEEEDENAKTLRLANEKNKEDADDSGQAAHKSQSLGRVRSRRFNFRFGNNNAAVAEGDAPTSSNNAPTTSRHSLRSSLSTYFNSVFKRKQGANSKHTLRTSKKKNDDQAENDGNENGIEMVEQKLPAPEGNNPLSLNADAKGEPPILPTSDEITPTATPPPQAPNYMQSQ